MIVNMNLEDRIKKAQEDYDRTQETRLMLLKQAEDCQVEMNRLQGEYRVLEQLLGEQEDKKEPIPTVSVKDEGKSKKERVVK